MSTCNQLDLQTLGSRPVMLIIGENRQLVTGEPVEFEKQPVEVQDCRRITDHLKELIEYTTPI